MQEPDNFSDLVRAALIDGIDGLLDALWLARAMTPSVSDVAQATQQRAEQTPELPTRSYVAPTNEVSLPVDGTPRRQVDVTLDEEPLAARHGGKGLYGHAAAAQADGPRARVANVAGVPALPRTQAHALAIALRPLARRRPSPREKSFDAEATVESYAQSRLLVPQFSPQRRHFFDALLLVEDMPSGPLWQRTVDEFEQLLRRQCGFHSLRRHVLETDVPRPQVRLQGGATVDPSRTLAGDAPLVLVASDGTSAAWADGRIAAMLDALGARASVVIVQLLPERLWRNTAMGRADVGVRASAVGAPLSRLRVVLPDNPADPMHAAIDVDDAVVAVPVVSLRQESVARWARMQMAQRRASSWAVLLRRAVAADDGARRPGASTTMPAVDKDPMHVIAEARGVAGERVLQAAVYLSAAAPLTLPIVRLVQRAMQPGSPAGDLALLMLSGVLVRSPASAPGIATAGDDAIAFDFAPGVRALLQRSLRRDEALAVRRAVSAYIGDQAGLPHAFLALIEDPEGDVLLPAWARPFAELCREIDALFDPRGRQSRRQRHVLEDVRAPGVTVRATLGSLKRVTEVSYSPDGRRLAVRDDAGFATYSLPVDAQGLSLAPQRDPIRLKRDPILLVFTNGGLPDFEAHVALLALRRSLEGLFSNPWAFHMRRAPEGPALRPSDPVPANLIREIRNLIAHYDHAVVVASIDVLGDVMSTVMRELGEEGRLAVQLSRRVPASLPDANWMLSGPRGPYFEPFPALNCATAVDVGLAAATRIRDAASANLSRDLLLGPLTVEARWWPKAAPFATGSEDAGFGIVALQQDLSWAGEPDIRLTGWPKVPEGTFAFAVDPARHWIAWATRDQFRVEGLSKKALAIWKRPPNRAPVTHIEFSPSSGEVAFLEGHAVTIIRHGRYPLHHRFEVDADIRAPAPAWNASQNVVAFVAGDGILSLRHGVFDRFVGDTRSFDGRIIAFAWSPDSTWLCVATDKGRLSMHSASIDSPPIVAWAAKEFGKEIEADWLQVGLAFSPRTIDGRFLELSVACGERVELLRIDPGAWMAPRGGYDSAKRIIRNALSTAVNADLYSVYVERIELAEACLAQLGQGGFRTLVMLGPRLAGKTAFLRLDLVAAAEAVGYLVVYVDGWADRSPPAAVIARALQKTAAGLDLDGGRPNPEDRSRSAWPSDDDLAGADFHQRIEELLVRLTSSAPLLLLIDEVEFLMDTSHSAGWDVLREVSARFGDRIRLACTGSDRSAATWMHRDSNFLGDPLETLSVEFPLPGEQFVAGMLNQLERRDMGAGKLDLDEALRAFDRVHRLPGLFLDVLARVLREPGLELETVASQIAANR